MSIWHQTNISLRARNRGFHLITREIVEALPELNNISVGLLHIFIQHTSASLSLNENADPDVRSDMEQHFTKFVPENAPYYDHVLEGPDDMPAHIKCTTIGASLSIPVSKGQLALGTWQGIYLGEHRNHGGSRHLVLTLSGRLAG
mgnify:CR=1